MFRIGNVAALFLVFAIAACESGSEGSEEGGVAEAFSLAGVGGDTLPAVLTEDSVGRLELAGGSLTLNPDRTFSMDLITQVTMGGVASPDTGRQSGTYVLGTDSIAFNYSGGANEVGTREGDRIVLNSSGFVLTFEKR